MVQNLPTNFEAGESERLQLRLCWTYVPQGEVNLQSCRDQDGHPCPKSLLVHPHQEQALRSRRKHLSGEQISHIRAHMVMYVCWRQNPQRPPKKEAIFSTMPESIITAPVWSNLRPLPNFSLLTSSSMEEPRAHWEGRRKVEEPREGGVKAPSRPFPCPSVGLWDVTDSSWRDQSFHFYLTGLINIVPENKTF